MRRRVRTAPRRAACANLLVVAAAVPLLAGAALSVPSRLRLVAVRAYGGAFILDVDHATTRTVGGLGLGRRTSPSGPLAAGLWAVPGGALAAVERDPCLRCAERTTYFVI